MHKLPPSVATLTNIADARSDRMLKQFRATVTQITRLKKGTVARNCFNIRSTSPVRLLVSVTLEKREGACALFVQKTPDMFTNLPSARKTLLGSLFWLTWLFICLEFFVQTMHKLPPSFPM